MLYLKEFREQAGLTQCDLAKKINATQASISQYEKGKREPNFKKLKEIVKVLNITTDQLLGIKKTTTNTNPARRVVDSGSD